MINYDEVAKSNNMTEPIKTIFIAYMRMRWGNKEDEIIKCKVGYAQEWAERFMAGIEFSSSDNVGKRILSEIDAGHYGREWRY